MLGSVGFGLWGILEMLMTQAVKLPRSRKAGASHLGEIVMRRFAHDNDRNK